MYTPDFSKLPFREDGRFHGNDPGSDTRPDPSVWFSTSEPLAIRFSEERGIETDSEARRAFHKVT